MAKYRIKDSEFDKAVLAFKKKYLLSLLTENKLNILNVSRKTKLSRNTIYKIIGLTKSQLKTEVVNLLITRLGDCMNSLERDSQKSK